MFCTISGGEGGTKEQREMKPVSVGLAPVAPVAPVVPVILAEHVTWINCESEFMYMGDVRKIDLIF